MILSTMSSTQKTCQSTGSLPPLRDQVPIESEEERAASEQDEIAALDAVGDYEADATVMLEDVPKDIVIKNLKVWCACVSVLVCVCVCACVCVCVCVCVCAVYVFVRIFICIF